MTRRLLSIRPEPGAAATLAAGHARGLKIASVPLFALVDRAWEPPSPDSVDALLLGSANAVRLAGPGLGVFAGKPVHAVGQATAEAARGAGLTVASTGEGRLQTVLDRVAPPRTLLRLAGEEHVPLSPPAGVSLVTRIVYAAEPKPLPAVAEALLHDGAVVLLHSAAAARYLAAECDRLEVDRGQVSLAAMAPRIADAAGGGWRDCRAAATPDEQALLALAADLCHDSGEASRG